MVHVTIRQWAELLDTLTHKASEAEVKKQLKQFVALVGKHRMMGKMNDIIAAYEDITMARDGIIGATVTVDQALSNTSRKHVEAYLKKEFKAESVVLEERIDAGVIGGMKIKVGNTVLDNTIRGRLEQLRTTLTI